MYRLRKLPYKKEYISKDIYIFLSDANYTLGELKGILDHSNYIDVIIRLLNMYEAMNSSKIEGIHSTYRDLFLHSITPLRKDDSTTEVVNHIRATNILYRDVILSNKISMEDVTKIQNLISPKDSGVRKLRGHKIYNKVTQEVLYIPPQNKNAILDYYNNLLDYINTPHETYDPLIKMAIIHYQFECIHPYKDGNGRVGRILNSMALVQSKRLSYPILNLSKYFNETREQYFNLLEKCHNNISYLDEFIAYVLKGISETTRFSIVYVNQITRVMSQTKIEIISKLPKIYSERLLRHLFKYPYTKNELFRTELNISRTTSTRYLKLLENEGFLESIKYGKEVVYRNCKLSNIFN